MACDWIKMRTDLYRDPKVCAIADMLLEENGELARYVSLNTSRDMCVTRNVMRNVTVGALVAVWGVTRHRGKRDGNDLVLRATSVTVIDDIADLPGLGEAMLFVGWISEGKDGLVFPNFYEEMNTDPYEDAKQKAAERQRRYRAKRNVTGDVTVTSQCDIEKSREEKRNTNTRRVFAKPTLEEISAYCVERKNGVDPQAFLDHYTANGWRVGKSPMKDWQASVRTWERNIAERVKQQPQAPALPFAN